MALDNAQNKTLVVEDRHGQHRAARLRRVGEGSRPQVRPLVGHHPAGNPLAGLKAQVDRLEAASSKVRAKLEAANPQLVAAIRDTVDDVATAMQHEVRKGSRAHAVAVREAKRRFNVRPITEASVHGPAHAQDFEKTVVALARLGVFPVDLVERALLDEGEDMLLLLAKAAGCSWTTAREMLVMFAANRNLQPDDITMAFERYRKLSQQTARNIVTFYERRMKLRKAADAKGKSTRGRKDKSRSEDDNLVSLPSPSIVPV